MSQLSLDVYPEITKQWIESMRVEAVKFAKENGEVSADDIRSRFPIPKNVKVNALGSLFKTKDFIWKGVKKSTTPSRAGSMISVWTLRGNV